MGLKTEIDQYGAEREATAAKNLAQPALKPLLPLVQTIVPSVQTPHSFVSACRTASVKSTNQVRRFYHLNNVEVPHRHDRRKSHQVCPHQSVAKIACDFRWRSNSPRSAYKIAGFGEMNADKLEEVITRLLKWMQAKFAEHLKSTGRKGQVMINFKDVKNFLKERAYLLSHPLFRNNHRDIVATKIKPKSKSVAPRVSANAISAANPESCPMR